MTIEIIKSNYERGLWGDTELQICMKKGLLSKEDYEALISPTAEKKILNRRLKYGSNAVRR